MTTPVRAYSQPIDRYWWAKRRSYLLFMLREISCIFVAWFVVYLLLLVHATSAGRDSYMRFLGWSANPLVVAVNIVALIFLLLHVVTWFSLAPRAMVFHIRGRRVPARAVLAGHYALSGLLRCWYAADRWWPGAQSRAARGHGRPQRHT